MEPTDSFSLRWDDFEANTLVALKELREEREFCDVTLATDGKQVSAHKVILAGGSTFFQQILKQNPHPHPLIYLKGVRYEYLLSVLDFVYTGEANISEKELVPFLDVADDLQIKGLIEKNPQRQTSTNEGETIPSNVSHQDESSDVKKEAGPLLHAETPSPHGNNPGYQSTCEEVPIDTPFDVNIKVEQDDQIHSTASFGKDAILAGLTDMKDVTDFKTEISNSYEIGSISQKGQITADVCQQSEDVSDDALTPNSGKLGPVFTSSDQQKSNLPIHQLEFSAPYFNSGIEKSNCDENHDGNQILEDDNAKTKIGDTSSFHFNFEEDSYVEKDYFRGFDDKNQVISEGDKNRRVPVDTVSGENEKKIDNWYEEGEEYVSVRYDGKPDDNHNDDELSTMKKGRKVCPVCGKSVNFELKVHMRTHTGEKSFSCSFCPKTFRKSSHLKVHTRTHTGEKPFPCLLCPKTFGNSSNLKMHTRIHTGEKPFPCSFCPKTFGNSSDLKKHTRIHTGEKPFPCSFCPKTFGNSSDLKKHTRIHTGEKPFPCLLCPETFRESSKLERHTRKHTGEKPFQCLVCFKRFTRSDNLNVHKKQKHCSV